MTKQRRIILDIVSATKSHPTAYSVYCEAKTHIPDIAVGTVYRNLGILADEGLIRKIDLPGLPARYDGTLTPHDHAMCVECEQFFDIEDGVLSGLIPSEIDGNLVLSANISIRCVCSRCREAKAKASK